MGEEEATREASMISRRRALKVGVAAGVGAAVWGGPQIGRIGSTPAYAQECTVPSTRYAAIKGNIDAGQRRYKDPTPLSCANITSFPGDSRITFEAATSGECGADVGSSGEPGAPTGGAGVCLEPTGLALDGQFCKLEVQILSNQGDPCDAPVLVDLSPNPNPTFSAAVEIDGSTWIPLPDPFNTSSEKYRVFVLCSTDPACLA